MFVVTHIFSSCIHGDRVVLFNNRTGNDNPFHVYTHTEPAGICSTLARMNVDRLTCIIEFKDDQSACTLHVRWRSKGAHRNSVYLLGTIRRFIHLPVRSRLPSEFNTIPLTTWKCAFRIEHRRILAERKVTRIFFFGLTIY